MSSFCEESWRVIKPLTGKDVDQENGYDYDA